MNTAEQAIQSLAEFTSARLIASDLQIHTTSGVAGELNRLLVLQECLPENFTVPPSMLCRELLTSTTLNGGMLTLPMRSSPARRTCFALARSRLPLPWRAKWLTPVQLVCLALEAPSQSAGFRQMMTGLTRLAGDISTISQLHAAAGVEEMLTVLGRMLVCPF